MTLNQRSAVIHSNSKPESMKRTPLCLSDPSDAKANRSIESNGIRPLSYNWAFAFGIKLILLGVILFSLRAALISLIIMIIGISLFTSCLYLGTRLKELKSQVSLSNR